MPPSSLVPFASRESRDPLFRITFYQAGLGIRAAAHSSSIAIEAKAVSDRDLVLQLLGGDWSAAEIPEGEALRANAEPASATRQ